MSISQKNVMWIALATGLISLLVYLRSLSCGFVNLDDHDFILNNDAIKHLDLNLLSWAFTTIAPISGAWIPLSWFSYAIDYRLWGGDPFGYHLTSILLHAINTGLVVMIADSLYRSRLANVGAIVHNKYLYSAVLVLAGLLYGIHPLRVESVAWMTERRGVLNGVFTLGTIFCYLRYTQHRQESASTGRTATRYYLLSLAFLSLSFMAKPISVTIPVLLLVLDWYPLGRMRKGEVLPILLEKVPYLFLSAALSLGTIYLGTREDGLLLGAGELTFWNRVVLSGNALFEYCLLTVYPVDISPLTILTSPIPVSYSLKAAAIVFLCICVYIVRKQRWLSATWLCFLIPVLPVLTFFQVNNVAFAPRYTYLPAVVPSITAAALVGVIYHKASAHRRRYLSLLLAGVVVVVLASYVVITQRLIDVWKDSGTMWSRVIQFQPYDRAYFLRALFYVDSGNYQAAVDDYTVCLNIAVQEKLSDNFVYNIYGYRGEAFARAGRNEEAVQDFSTALAMLPHPLFFYHRAMALQALGRVGEAAEDFSKAGRAKGQMSWIYP